MGFRLGQPEKFSNESSFREDLMNQDLADRAASRVRAELELVIAKLAPHRSQLVGLRGVGVHEMLENGGGAGNVAHQLEFRPHTRDRKSTRLNSSHMSSSYA